jgi:hypothetical protein
MKISKALQRVTVMFGGLSALRASLDSGLEETYYLREA